jgi:tRNA threonylcarbamoyladenosine biosynthesis protein TsaE
MTQDTSTLVVRRVGPDAAGTVAALIREAFADREPLDPPTAALAETSDSVAALLEGAGGLVAELDGRPVGTLVLDERLEPGALHLRRFGLTPAARGQGVAGALVRNALLAAGELDVARIVVEAREELPATIEFWQSQGFVETAHRPPYVELARPVPAVVDVPDPDAMRALAARVASVVRAGDVLVLSGDLGAGKTTFTQGLGAALGVRGDVTSPTFVIARVHPSLGTGPALVHVDAYRLDGTAELDDLDLDTDLDQAVTVVEWGAGLAEGLSDSPMEIRIHRAAADDADADDHDPRRVEIDPLGPRWLGVELPDWALDRPFDPGV